MLSPVPVAMVNAVAVLPVSRMTWPAPVPPVNQSRKLVKALTVKLWLVSTSCEVDWPAPVAVPLADETPMAVKNHHRCELTAKTRWLWYAAPVAPGTRPRVPLAIRVDDGIGQALVGRCPDPQRLQGAVVAGVAGAGVHRQHQVLADAAVERGGPGRVGRR